MHFKLFNLLDLCLGDAVSNAVPDSFGGGFILLMLEVCKGVSANGFTSYSWRADSNLPDN